MTEEKIESPTDCIMRLRKENEEWQKEYWKMNAGNDFLAEKISNYRAENEMLKQENRLLYKELREIRDKLTEILDDEND